MTPTNENGALPGAVGNTSHRATDDSMFAELTLDRANAAARSGAGVDTVTVLRSDNKVLVKRWQADGSIKAYDNAKNYRVRHVPVGNAMQLSTLLKELEADPHACIVRGRHVGFDNARKLEQLEHPDQTFRRAALFDDEPLHVFLAEVDNFKPLTADPVIDPVGAIEEFIFTQLPDAFHCVSYHWQLSNSAGYPDKRHLLKAHIWFWLRTPYTSEQLKTWAAAIGLKTDHSVFQKIQCHYTGAPVFDAGVVDPVPVRSGFVQGLIEDAVDLTIDTSEFERAQGERVSRGEKLRQAAHSDPVAQHLIEQGYLKGCVPDGKLNIECPFADQHTGVSSVSATVYYPAHTGGYERGHFKCQHAHCIDRPRSEYLDKIGYSESMNAFETVRNDAPAVAVGQPRTANQILDQEFSPLKWVVPKVLPEGVYLLIAAPKIGKSWLALQMVLAVATGTEILGQTAEAGAALYLALEDNDRRLQKRLRELNASMLLSTAQGADLQFETQWPLSNEGGAEAIAAWLTAHPNARLVVVDVLERFRPRRSAKGNLYAEDYAALRALKLIADEHRVAILVVHHTRKGATDDPLAMVSGTQGLAGSADGMLLLERDRGAARGKLHVIGRDIEEDGEYVVEFAGCEWTMVGPSRAVAKTLERQEILETLQEVGGGPLSAKDIADVLGKKRPAVARLLTKMTNEGCVIWENHKYTASLTLTPVTEVTRVTK